MTATMRLITISRHLLELDLMFFEWWQQIFEYTALVLIMHVWNLQIM